MKVRRLLYGEHDPYELKPAALLPFDDNGWGSDRAVFKTVIDEINPSLIVEVGTWKGKSARHMASLAPNAEIVCVDTFLGSVEHWTGESSHQLKFVCGIPTLYLHFISNTIHANLQNQITPLPIDSVNGALVLKKHNVMADLIYIDAGHEYESVVSDFVMYKDLVRPGGILLGDDYHHPPIIDAAAKVFGTVEPNDGKFIWRRPA